MVHFTVLGMGVMVSLNVGGRFQLELQRLPLRASERQEEMRGWGQVNGVMGDGMGTRWSGGGDKVERGGREGDEGMGEWSTEEGEEDTCNEAA